MENKELPKNITFAHDIPSDHYESADAFVTVVQWLCIYYSLFLVICGCFCNPMSFIVFSRRSFRNTTMSIYLRFLSVSDLGALLNGLLRFFMQQAYNTDPRSDAVACVVSVFCSNLFLYASSWTLVIVTLERVVSIIWPHRVHIWCTPLTALVTLVGMVIVLSLCSFPASLLYGDDVTVDPVTNETLVLYCQGQIKDPVLVTAVWVMYATVFALAPSLLLVIFNIVIVLGIARSRKRVMKKTFVKEVSAWTATVTSETTMSSDLQRLSRRSDRRSRREASLTLTLLTVNVTFIICNFPACVYMFNPYYTTEEELGVVGPAVGDFLMMLMYTNNAMNFGLYCVTGSKFRAEVKAVILDAMKCCMFHN